MRELCFIDVETTGAVFGHHEIIDIGVVKTTEDASAIQAEWSKRVRPQFPGRLTPDARRVNGYSEVGWGSAAEPSKQLWLEFSEFVQGCTPVCHNPSFDRAFITLAAREQGITDVPLDYHWIGTESLGWPLIRKGQIERLSLSSLCRFLKVGEEPNPHNALDGARACMRVYRALMQGYLS